jgi:hypothetical protein
MKKISAAIATTILSACSAMPVVTTQPVNLPSHVAEVVCVLIPAAATFGGKFYAGSGDEVAEKIREAIEKTGNSARLVSQAQTDPIANCRGNGSSLILQPTIIYYEDNLTGWSGKPDQISIQLTLYPINQPDQKRSTVYTARSNLVYSAFLEWGNAKPSALLGDEFVASLRQLLP